MVQQSTPSLLVSTLSCSGCGVVLLLVNSGFICSCHWLITSYEGTKPPLYGWWGSLFIWVGIFHVKEVDTSLSLFLTTEGYLPITPLCLVLLTMTQFHEWSHQSRGSPSNGIYSQQCHSLSQTHMFLLMSTATSCYLRSSPIFHGHSSGCPW